MIKNKIQNHIFLVDNLRSHLYSFIQILQFLIQVYNTRFLKLILYILYATDHAMSRETFIAGDERAQFLYKSGIESRNVHGSGTEYISDAVVLVFARDRHKASGICLFIHVLTTSFSFDN